jgi:hypothetical protein
VGSATFSSEIGRRSAVIARGAHVVALLSSVVALFVGLVALFVGLVALFSGFVALFVGLVALLLSVVTFVARLLQVVLEGYDLSRGSERVSLIEQFADSCGDGELTAGVAAVSPRGSLRPDQARRVEAAQERGLDLQQFRGLADRVSGEVVVVELVKRHDVLFMHRFLMRRNDLLRLILMT